MSLCDMEIFKTAVVQKWGPIKLGQWLICHKEPLVNYNQRSNDLFEWYLDFPSFFLFGRDLRKSPHLIFVIFLRGQNFWRIKFTPKKGVNYDKIHSKLPIFCVITAKYTVNCQIFALNLKKIYTGQKKFTWEFSWLSWQIWGMHLLSALSTPSHLDPDKHIF